MLTAGQDHVEQHRGKPRDRSPAHVAVEKPQHEQRDERKQEVRPPREVTDAVVRQDVPVEEEQQEHDRERVQRPAEVPSQQHESREAGGVMKEHVHHNERSSPA